MNSIVELFEWYSLNCLNCDAEMTVHHQCEDILATDSEGNWEDIESEQDLYPTLDWKVMIGLTSLRTVFEDFMVNTVEMC